MVVCSIRSKTALGYGSPAVLLIHFRENVIALFCASFRAEDAVARRGLKRSAESAWIVLFQHRSDSARSSKACSIARSSRMLNRFGGGPGSASRFRWRTRRSSASSAGRPQTPVATLGFTFSELAASIPPGVGRERRRSADESEHFDEICPSSKGTGSAKPRGEFGPIASTHQEQLAF
jgi:hypothetical protein